MVHLTALLSMSGGATAKFLNFYVSHSSAARFSKSGEKYYIFCRLFIAVSMKEFSKSVSHGSAMRFLINDKKYYIYFADNSVLFPTVKEFSKLVNS